MKHSALLLALFAVLSLMGCKSASSAAHSSATALSSEYRAASAASDVLTTTGQVISTLVPERDASDTAAPDFKKEAMQRQAGRHHFENVQLMRAKQVFQPNQAQYRGFKNQMQNPRFEEMRAGFRRAETPEEGSVLQSSGVPTLIRGVTTPVTRHPVLGSILPDFVK